jgi:hypothetical protein
VLIFHAQHFTLLLHTNLRRSAAQFLMLIGGALFVARLLLAALCRYQFDLFIPRAPSPGVMGGQFRVLLTPIPLTASQESDLGVYSNPFAKEGP